MADTRINALTGTATTVATDDYMALDGTTNGTRKILGSAFLTPTGSGASLTGITATQVGLGNVTNDTQTKAAIVPNTAPAAGQLLVGNAGGTAYAPVSSSGDVTIASTGAMTIGAAKVTNSQLSNVSTATFKGRTTAGTGSPEDLTGTQATALLDTFTSSLKGLAPSSGGGTTNFLRADGTWAAPGGGGGAVSSVTGTANQITVSPTTGNTVVSLVNSPIVSGTYTDGAGDLRSVPQNAKTSAYTLVVGDNGKYIDITTGGVTVPSGVFSAGQVVVIYNNSTSNQTITQGSSVTMYLSGTTSTGNRTLASYGVATVLCTASNTFVVTGSGLS